MIKTKEELLQLQAQLQGERKARKIQILVGMSSCGIAAGAKEVMAKFEELLKDKNVEGLVLQQTGCAGFCYTEPTVEIKKADGTVLLLGPVHEEDVQNVVDMHVLNNLTESKYVIPHSFKGCFE